MMTSNIEQFRAAIIGAGLTPPDVIEPDKLHRFPGIGKRNGNTAGWCKLFADGMGGSFGDWSTGLHENWQAKRDKPMSEAERRIWQGQIEKARKQAEAERDAQHAEAAQQAKLLYGAGRRDESADHPYAMKKRVDLFSLIRRGEWLQRGWADALLVPLFDASGSLATLQAINVDGEKDYLKGGRKRGCFYPFGKLRGAEIVLIGEGVATVAAGVDSTGWAAAAAMDAGNLLSTAQAMRELAPEAAILFLADNDVRDDGRNPGVEAARAAAEAVGGFVAVPELDGRACDWWDVWNEHGAGIVGDLLRAALASPVEPEAADDATPHPAPENPPAGEPAPARNDDEIIAHLASLSPLEYDRVRKEEAEAMGVRPATLDKMVTAARKAESNGGMEFDEVEPWAHPVEPALLLAEIACTVRRFIVCDRETADATALWTALTWFIDDVQVAPLAVITAPEKRCGKSQLLSVLSRMVQRPLIASNISPAALFRAVDAWKPTLLVDEADAFMRDNEELRGILNAGHTRESAYVVRVVGEELKPQRFNVWGCKALAGIGHLADTLMDRAITLELRRKLPHEQAERLRHAEPGLFDEIASKLARFADDYREAIRRTRPDLPASLNDRAQDNWEPLLAIADVAGGEWPELARRAALKLSGSDSPTMTTGTELLADVKAVFESKGLDRISTSDLIEALCADTEAPWATYNRGRPISPRQVAKRLSDYGIASQTIRIGLNTPKGYLRTAFEEAFLRYLTPPPPASATPPQTSQGAGLRVADAEARCGNRNSSATPKPASDKACGGVADTRGDSGSVDEIVEEVF